MAVKVINFKVKHDGKIFTTEEGNNIIEGLPEEEEQLLIANGFCEKYKAKESKKLKKDKDPEEVI
jgi:hypothetical protein